MKARKGFVSNSSSSSFIVTLPQDIEKYSLEEFRELVYAGNHFDPVEQLYNDLLNKEKSQIDLTKYEQKRYGIKKLDYNQYIVHYGNECRDYGDKLSFDDQSTMEYDFMGSLEESSDYEISVKTFDNH